MPKSRTRKKRIKSKKPRLVMEFDADTGARYLIPHMQTGLHQFRGIVSVEDARGRVDEYELRTDAPISLSEFIGSIRQDLANLVDDASRGFNVQVFARA